MRWSASMQQGRGREFSLFHNELKTRLVMSPVNLDLLGYFGVRQGAMPCGRSVHALTCFEHRRVGFDRRLGGLAPS